MKVDIMVLREYWFRACAGYSGKVSRWDSSFEASMGLAEELGIPYKFPGDWNTIVLTPELQRILILIAGPHGRTILKMIKIKKEAANAGLLKEGTEDPEIDVRGLLPYGNDSEEIGS